MSSQENLPVDPAHVTQAQRPAKKRKRKPSARVLRNAVKAGRSQKPKLGQPTLFKPIFIRICKRLASAGLTDDEMAAHLGVAPRTFDDWKVRHPKLMAVLKVGKEAANNRVERSLYQRALGYTVKAQKPFVDRFGVEHVVEHVEHVEPDTVAQIFFLKNRDPDNWRDRIDHSFEAGDLNYMRALQERRTAVDKERREKGLPQVVDGRPTHNGWGAKIDWDGIDAAAAAAPKPNWPASLPVPAQSLVDENYPTAHLKIVSSDTSDEDTTTPEEA